MSPSRLASSRSNRAARSFSRARGMTSLSTKSRAVSEIRRCSSLSSRSTARRLRRQRLLAASGRERLRGLGASAARCAWSSCAVDRRDRLDLADGRGEEGLGRREQVVEANSPSSTSSDRDQRGAGDRLEDPGRDRRASAARPSGETQKIEDVGASRTMPSGRTSTASSAPLRLGDPRRLHVGRVRERLDAGRGSRVASR